MMKVESHLCSRSGRSLRKLSKVVYVLGVACITLTSGCATAFVRSKSTGDPEHVYPATTLDAFFFWNCAILGKGPLPADPSYRVNLPDRITETACANATQSAERLSYGFGKKIKGVRAISEDEFSEVVEPFFSGGRRPARITKIPGTDTLDFPVVPATISFEKTVYAIFEIK